MTTYSSHRQPHSQTSNENKGWVTNSIPTIWIKTVGAIYFYHLHPVKHDINRYNSYSLLLLSRLPFVFSIASIADAGVEATQASTRKDRMLHTLHVIPSPLFGRFHFGPLDHLVC